MEARSSVAEQTRRAGCTIWLLGNLVRVLSVFSIVRPPSLGSSSWGEVVRGRGSLKGGEQPRGVSRDGGRSVGRHVQPVRPRARGIERNSLREHLNYCRLEVPDGEEGVELLLDEGVGRVAGPGSDTRLAPCFSLHSSGSGPLLYFCPPALPERPSGALADGSSLCALPRRLSL